MPAALPMQTLVDGLLAGEAKMGRLMARFAVERIIANGGPDLSHRIGELEAAFEQQLLPADVEALVFHDTGGEAQILHIASDEQALDEFFGRVETATGQNFNNLVDTLFQTLLTSIREGASTELKKRASSIEAFERRLRLRWQKPLELLGVQIGLSAQFGEEMNDWLRKRITQQNSATIEAQTRLHARATQVAGEVEVLLRTGYADGAMSRWRTIHELAMVAYFIQQHGEEVAQRYLDHLSVDSLRMARVYRSASEKLGYEPMADAEWDQLQKAVNSLKDMYGKEFGSEYGWAAKALGKDAPKFADIERAVEFEKLRPYYKMASDNVHAGPKGAFRRLGTLPEEEGLLLAGPSNAGLEEAGRLTAMSLAQIAAPLMAIEPSVDGIVWLRVLFELSKEIEKEFLACKAKLLADHSRISHPNNTGAGKPRRRLTPRQRRV
jgi:hypothetical protein